MPHFDRADSIKHADRPLMPVSQLIFRRKIILHGNWVLTGSVRSVIGINVNSHFSFKRAYFSSLSQGWSPLTLYFIFAWIILLRFKMRDWRTSLTLHLHEELLHNHVYTGNDSHICCHCGNLPGELGSHPHPIASMMMVRSAPTCWATVACGTSSIFFLTLLGGTLDLNSSFLKLSSFFQLLGLPQRGCPTIFQQTFFRGLLMVIV